VEVAPDQVIPDFWQLDLRSIAVVMLVLPDDRILTLTGYPTGRVKSV
jgi:hypothetical protein